MDTLWIDNLRQLIALIQASRAERVHPEAVIAELVRDHGARHSDHGSYRLRLAGIEAISVASNSSLLTRWTEAAMNKTASADDGFNPYGSGPVPIEPRSAP